MKAVNPIIIIKKECSVSNINSDQYILLMTFLILLMWEDHSDQNSFLHPWHIAMNKLMSIARREMAKHLSSTRSEPVNLEEIKVAPHTRILS